MALHSPEPWRVEDYNSNCGYVFDANGDDIHSGYFDGEMAPANAQRIVACVNACRGLPDINGTITLIADMKAAILTGDPELLEIVKRRLQEIPT